MMVTHFKINLKLVFLFTINDVIPEQLPLDNVFFEKEPDKELWLALCAGYNGHQSVVCMAVILSPGFIVGLVTMEIL